MFAIVARKFTDRADFAAYLKGLGRQGWVSKIVLHNTGVPSLSQRAGGILTEQHIENLQSFYSKSMGWLGGPHLFVDAGGVWVFNPLTKQGVHSPSFNRSAWGLEMLGDYEKESFSSGLGAQVRENTCWALAELALLQGWPNLNDGRLILHKEDKVTTHNCPGKNVNKSAVIFEANRAMKGAVSQQSGPTVLLNGKELRGCVREDGVTMAPLRLLAEGLGAKVAFDENTDTILITKD
jgi:hypothetical protein